MHRHLSSISPRKDEFSGNAVPFPEHGWRNGVHSGAATSGSKIAILQSYILCTFQAQNVGDEKSTKVLCDIVAVMLSKSFLDELFEPQEMCKIFPFVNISFLAVQDDSPRAAPILRANRAFVGDAAQ